MSPIDEDDLRSLLQDVRPADTTGVAAEAVARGTRTRQRRRVGVAAVVAVVLAGTGVAGLELTRRPQDVPAIQVTATPSTSPSPLAAVGAANLPTATDLAPLATSSYPLGTPLDHPAGSWGTTRVSLCQTHPNLGQTSLRVREFPAAHALAAVIGFDSTRQASQARTTILRWYRTCGTETKGAQASDWTGRNLPVKARGTAPVTATAAEATIPPDAAGNGQWEEASVVQAGNRLAWVVQGARGQDHECSLLPSDVVGQCGAYASAEAVARRLLR